MVMRSAMISGLVLAATLAWTQPGRAQGFFSFYEMSPRQIVGMLQDEGYQLRGPMYRRGDVYVCNVVSVSGRPARLIVSARDGRVLERYAAHGPRGRDAADPQTDMRPPRNVGDSGASGDDGGRMALGDVFNPPSRVYGNDSLLGSKSEDAPAQKTKRHAVKKHKEPSVAKAPASEATPTPEASDKPAANPPPATAAVAPTPAAEPSPPAQTAAPTPMQTRAEAEKAAEPSPVASPKPEPARKKKLNDLPVDTLD